MRRGGHSSVTRPRLVRAFAAPAVTGSLAATLPPVGGSESGTYMAPGATLFTETFADSSFASRGWYSIVSADRVASPAPSGMPGSLRMTWNSGQTLPSSGGMRKLFTATDSLYIKYQQAFSSNWVGSGYAAHPHLVMALSDLDDAYAGPSDNYLALYSEVIYSGGNQPAVRFQDNQYIDGAHIGSNVSEARSTCGANGQQGYADSWDLYQDAGFSHGWAAARNLTAGVVMATGNTAWHTVEVEVVLNSIVGGVGQLDGICRYWWDGTLVWERTNLIMRTGTRPNLKFNQFLFAPYIGNGSPVTQTTYIADLTVATARTSGGSPPASAAVSGTAASSWYESQVVAGGSRTLICTLTNDTWLAAGAAFDGQRQNIINGIVAATSPANGWNNQRPNIPVTALVRTSATVATLTVPALAGYSVTANEVLTWTVPSSAVTGGNAIVATPTVTITEGAPASGAGWLANLPSGYTNHIVRDFDCSAAVPGGTIGAEKNISGTDWTIINERNVGGGVSSVSRITDATAPQSPSYVWQWYQPAGTYSGGSGFGDLFAFLPGGTTKLYMCWYMKLSDGYWVHDVSNKLFEAFPSLGQNLHVQLGRSGNYFEAYDQYTDTVYTSLNNSYPPTGQWILVEVQVESGSPGIIRVWLDGVLHVEHTDQDVSPGNTGYETIGLFMHMGGGGMTLSADQYVYVDHVAVYSV